MPTYLDRVLALFGGSTRGTLSRQKVVDLLYRDAENKFERPHIARHVKAAIEKGLEQGVLRIPVGHSQSIALTAARAPTQAPTQASAKAPKKPAAKKASPRRVVRPTSPKRRRPAPKPRESPVARPRPADVLLTPQQVMRKLVDNTLSPQEVKTFFTSDSASEVDKMLVFMFIQSKVESEPRVGRRLINAVPQQMHWARMVERNRDNIRRALEIMGTGRSIHVPTTLNEAQRAAVMSRIEVDVGAPAA